MKDKTNKEKPLLGQTIECIGMMHRSLQSLYEDEYPKSPAWFAIMAQGPIDQIRDLLDDLEWLMEEMAPRQLSDQARLIEEDQQSEQIMVRKAA